MSSPRSTKSRSSPRSSSAPRRATQAPGRASGLFERLSLLIQEARWLVLGGMSLYVGLVLLGYNHADPGWSHSAEVERILNPGGRFGAWLADLLFSLFGLSAWWWVAFLGYGLVWGFRRLRLDAAPEHRSFLWVLLGFVVVLLSSSALEALRFHSHELIEPLRPGGLIGVESSRLLNEALGFTGSTLLLLPLFAGGLSLLTGLSWLWLAEHVGTALEAVWTSLFGSWSERRAALPPQPPAPAPVPAPTPRSEPVPAPVERSEPLPSPPPPVRQEPVATAPVQPAAAPMYAGGTRYAAVRAEPVAHDVPPEPIYADDPPPGVQAARGPVAPPAMPMAAAADDALLLTQRVEEGEEDDVAFAAPPPPAAALSASPPAAPAVPPAPVPPAPVPPAPAHAVMSAQAPVAPQPPPAAAQTQAATQIEAPAAAPPDDTFSDDAFIFAAPEPPRASAPPARLASAPAAVAPRTPAEVRQAAEPLLRQNHAAEFHDEFAQTLDDDDFDDEDFAIPASGPAQAPAAVAAPAHAAMAPTAPPRIVRAATLEEELAASRPSLADIDLLPPLELLDQPSDDLVPPSAELLESTARLIETRLGDFGVEVKVVGVYPGPVVTRYEIEPATGVKGSQVVNLGKDLARALSLVSLRVVETVPGKSCMALELPNSKRQMVRLLEVIGSQVWANMTSPLTVVLGKSIGGQPVVADLAKMPHLLVAGTTGSGKSVGINAMILSLIYKSDPSRVRLIMVDPKMLELSIYEGIPHLLAPVVTDMKYAANALNWCVGEMDKRFKLMTSVGVRNLAGFNKAVTEARQRGEPLANPFSLTPENPEPLQTLPYIVVIVDELADLMMVVGKKVEELIARLAQKARAAGIHLILATQRPSVDVITGLIKANVPTRIAFQVSSKIDSRTILDQMGAENLLGLGDMLYLAPGTGLPMRAHGAFVSDDEVHRVVNHLKSLAPPDYAEGILSPPEDETEAGEGGEVDDESDPLYDQAVEVVLSSRRATISYVQRNLRIGYNRAARLLDQMERTGLVSPMGSNGTREILVPERETE